MGTTHGPRTHTAPLSAALAADLEDAIRAAHTAASVETFTQAQRLLGPRPSSDASLEEWNVAVQVLAFRIEHAAGVDALGSVIGLRRWGVTWDTIGKAAGVSRQAAHTRWGAQARAVLDRYGTGELGGPVAADETDLIG